MGPLLLLCTSVLLFQLVSSFQLKGQIEWNSMCPDFNALHSARAVLDDGRRWSAGVLKDGTFVIRNVEPDQYVLSVLASDFLFDQVLVQVSNESSKPPTVMPYTLGTPMTDMSSPVTLPYPLRISARRRNQYYVPHEGFNLVGMFQNPMMLLMAFAGVMVFATPYLMKNLDTDAVKEVDERRHTVAKTQSSVPSTDIGETLSDWVGGPDGSKATKSAGKAGSTTVRTKSNKGRRK